jgi:hypothetical protein
LATGDVTRTSRTELGAAAASIVSDAVAAATSNVIARVFKVTTLLPDDSTEATPFRVRVQ